ncbi:hypothetical protein AAG906_031653 [Vitis piasezkii]
MAPKAFLILGILFFVKAIPFMKSESQMVNDSSTDVAQNSTSIVVSSSTPAHHVSSHRPSSSLGPRGDPSHAVPFN